MNIRGLGSDNKSSWVRSLRNNNEVGFVMLQETQFISVDGLDMGRFGGNNDFHYEWVASSGRSGGLVSIWDPKRLVNTVVVKHANFLIVSGTIKDNGKFVSCVNAYIPHNLNDKRRVWNVMRTAIGSGEHYVVVGGDFNCVRHKDERRNSKFNAVASEEFNDFIEDIGVCEYALRGRKFTFCAGNKLSRIDRIFVSSNFFNEWPNAEYRALPREYSDHCPLILKVVSRNFGAKPFRFFNSWLCREGIEEVVSRALSLEDELGGKPDEQFMNKLKRVKCGIKNWLKVVKFKEREEEDCLKKEVFDL
ncbi:uncharacterized protein LOC110914106 [Helianthus annuus]|uniref:uncharacterized protein LOC110914106 n=1 Tax=Helianthus annuus TaxID=4232 RepID=UPI000B8F09CF|nr:uncharacterized protein LOC110914106 [Helianthus annuus]